MTSRSSKNANYWRKGFPYLDGIQFKVQEDGDQRVTGLQGGQFDVIHDDGGKNLKTIEGFGSGFTVDLEPTGYREVGQTLLNVTRPPLNDLNIRKALAMAVDRDTLNQIANDGKWEISNSVFDSKVMGYVSDPGFPKYDPAGAKKLVNAVEAGDNGGKTPTFNLQSTFDQTTQALAKEVKRQLAEVGINVVLPAPVDQATIINQAIGSQVDAFLWRNYPGEDPDTMYVWFYGGSVVNFNHVDDEVMNSGARRRPLGAGPGDPQGPLRGLQQAPLVAGLHDLELVPDLVHRPRQQREGHPRPEPAGRERRRRAPQKPADILAGYHQLLGMWKSN